MTSLRTSRLEAKDRPALSRRELALLLTAAVATALATLLTQLWFPARYWDLVDLQPGPLALLVTRNLVLLVAAALAVVALARLRAPATPCDITSR